MINISKSGNAIKFVFTDSDHYLYGNGEIEVPVNSLSLIVDESNMVTFRKSSSNDIFLSFNPSNSNLSDKAGVIDFYKSNMVGSTGGGSGSGMTPSEVQEMIDESVSGKADTATVNQIANEAAQAILSVSGGVQTNAGNIQDIYDTIDEKEEVIASALTDVRQDVADIDAKEEVIASALTEVRQDVNTLSGDVNTLSGDVADKQDALQYYSETDDVENGEKESKIEIEQSNENDSAYAFIETYTQFTENDKYSYIDLNTNTQTADGRINYTDLSLSDSGIQIYYDKGENGVTQSSHIDMGTSGVGSQITIQSTDDSQSTIVDIQSTGVTINDEKVLTEGDVDNALNSGSTNPVANSAITQALENKLDASAYTPTDLSQYWTSGQTQTAIDGVKAYYINFATLTTQGIHDADWDAMVAAINAHRPIYAGLGDLYYTAECLYQDGSNRIIMTASDHNSHYFYTFVKNGSEDYSFTYETKPYVTDAEKSTWNAKQDALSAGTGIEISGNVISATGGGGATYSAGTNISIDTGNTINCTLPITANTSNLQGYLLFGSNISVWGSESNGRYQIVIGKQISNPAYAQGQVAICPADTSSASNSVLTGDYPIGIGHMITSRGNGAVAIGDTANANGNGYVAIGQRVNATGTTKMNLNNQITVDTSNQVYISNSANTSTYCVQQKIETTEAALGGLKFVKLTQNEYDALTDKDANTLYIITNVVS